MVTSVTTKQVTDILNGQTTAVQTLAKAYGGRLGATVGRVFLGLAACFSRSASNALKNAQAKDQLPGKIQATAERVAELAKQPKVLLGLVEDKHVNGVKIDTKTKKQETVIQTEALAADVKLLAKQAQELAAAYGHNNVNAYVEALSQLITEKAPGLSKTTMREILGQNFLVDSTVRAHTIAFAEKPASEVASGFEKFVADMKAAFTSVSGDLIEFRILKKLAKILNLNDLVAHVNAHNDTAVAAEIKKQQAPIQTQIDEAMARVAVLRGTDRNGEIHTAWVNYMKAMCCLILEIDRATPESEGRRLTDQERAKITALSKDAGENVKEAEATINNILRREGFGTTTLSIFSLDQASQLTDTTEARAAQGIAIEAKKKFDELKAEEVKLAGDGKDAVRVDEYNVAPESKIAKLVAERKTKGTKVAEEFSKIRKDALNLLAKLVAFQTAQEAQKNNTATATVSGSLNAIKGLADLALTRVNSDAADAGQSLKDAIAAVIESEDS